MKAGGRNACFQVPCYPAANMPYMSCQTLKLCGGGPGSCALMA